MENAVKERIKEVLHYKKITLSGFAGDNNALQKKLSRQINLGGGLTFETISAILERYPDISAEWLLRGNGEMHKASAPADTNQISEVEAKRIKEGEGYLKLIKTQNEQIKLQQEQINTLIELLDNKNYEN